MPDAPRPLLHIGCLLLATHLSLIPDTGHPAPSQPRTRRRPTQCLGDPPKHPRRPRDAGPAPARARPRPRPRAPPQPGPRPRRAPPRPPPRPRRGARRAPRGTVRSARLTTGPARRRRRSLPEISASLSPHRKTSGARPRAGPADSAPPRCRGSPPPPAPPPRPLPRAAGLARPSRAAATRGDPGGGGGGAVAAAPAGRRD